MGNWAEDYIKYSNETGGEIIREERAEEAARDAVESCSFFL